MGYSFGVGELQKTIECEGTPDEFIWYYVDVVTHSNAPAFGEPTDFTNQRWPSYTSWSWFLKYVDLHCVFFERGRLIGGHPGYIAITQKLLSTIEKTWNEYRALHPSTKFDFHTEESAALCRLKWLAYWTRWAYDNCDNPVIVNH